MYCEPYVSFCCFLVPYAVESNLLISESTYKYAACVDVTIPDAKFSNAVCTESVALTLTYEFVIAFCNSINCAFDTGNNWF